MLLKRLEFGMKIYIAVLVMMIIVTMMALPCAVVAETGEDEMSLDDLAGKSLEDLLNIPVTSVSKRAEKLSDSPAAIYVITQEDIKRTGATSIAEALRMVPGFQVGHVTASKWSIGSRGFCDVFSNKLLVLIDGRSVYSPLFSGVIWDVQDTMLEDIDRIEVIRGPGATLWGANAVNGVVNVVTKAANDTRGNLTVFGGATADQTQTKALRIGGKLGAFADFRVYTKSVAYDDFRNVSGQELGDDWGQTRSGFRVDYEDPSGRNALTLQGDIYNEKAGGEYVVGYYNPPYTRDVSADIISSGSNALLRWTSSPDSKTNSTLQVYYDRAKRSDPMLFGEDRTTLDLDYQRETHPGSQTALVWGLGYRYSVSKCDDGESVSFKYNKNTDSLYSAFIQNDQTVIPDRIRLILGAKLEHNDLTGYEFQPNARMVWTPSSKVTFWGAISKAVRTPSVADFYSMYHIIAPPDVLGKPRVITIMSNPEMESEKLTAYELGHRIQPSQNLWFDVAGFWNFYDDLRSAEPGAPWIESTFIDDWWQEHRHTPFFVKNNFRGNSRGIEASADWVISKRWRLKFGASAMNLWLDRSRSYDITGANMESTYPKKQYSIISYWEMPGNIQLDTAFYRVGGSETPVLAQASSAIPAYTRVDARLSLKDKNGGEWSLGAKNLTDTKHLESGSVYGEQATYVGRSFYFKTTRSF